MLSPKFALGAAVALAMAASGFAAHAQSDRVNAFTRSVVDDEAGRAASASGDGSLKPPLAVSPSEIKLGQRAGKRTVLIRNTAPREVRVRSFEVVGADGLVELDREGCTEAPLEEYDTCVAVFSVKPGQTDGDVIVEHDGLGEVHRIPVAPTQPEPKPEPGKLTLFPEKIEFSEAKTDAPRHRPVVAVNEGGSPVEIKSVAVYPTDGPVALAGSRKYDDLRVCKAGTTLAPDEGCTALIRWKPSRKAANEASLLVGHSGVKSVDSVPVTGVRPDTTREEQRDLRAAERVSAGRMLEGFDAPAPGRSPSETDSAEGTDGDTTSPSEGSEDGSAEADSEPAETSAPETSGEPAAAPGFDMSGFRVSGSSGDKVVLSIPDGEGQSYRVLKDGVAIPLNGRLVVPSIENGVLEFRAPDSGALLGRRFFAN